MVLSNFVRIEDEHKGKASMDSQTTITFDELEEDFYGSTRSFMVVLPIGG